MVAKKPWGMLFPEVFAFVSKDIVTPCHNIYFFSVIAPMRKALPLSWKIAFDKTERRAYTKITK